MRFIWVMASDVRLKLGWMIVIKVKPAKLLSGCSNCAHITNTDSRKWSIINKSRRLTCSSWDWMADSAKLENLGAKLSKSSSSSMLLCGTSKTDPSCTRLPLVVDSAVKYPRVVSCCRAGDIVWSPTAVRETSTLSDWWTLLPLLHCVVAGGTLTKNMAAPGLRMRISRRQHRSWKPYCGPAVHAF